MCGFVGVIGKSKINIESINEVKAMNSVIAHRGPDSQHIIVEDSVSLGFSRLSIIDVNGGDQPFVYKGGNYALVFNGEIYNYQELRDELINKGMKFEGNTEAEVIIASYISYGYEFLKKLRGMFAIVIYDKENKKVIWGRDQFGIKPFYYYENKTGLYFSSEMKAFKGIQGFNKELDIEGIHNYLSFQYVPEPNTVYKSVKILKPGYMCIIDENGNKSISEYCKIEFNSCNISKESKLKNIREALEDSIQHHMISDVPIATFLSGGIDSSIVAALASKINPNIESYTVGFDINGYSEIEKAKETAAFLGIKNTHKLIGAEEFIDELPKIIYHLDGPMADPSAIPIYFICKEVAKKYKVVLSGEGADELFGGYTIYKEPISLRAFEHIPESLKRKIKSLSNMLPENMKGRGFLQRGCTRIEDRYIGNANIFTNEEKSLFLNNYNESYIYQNVTRELYENARTYDGTTKMQYVDINTWLKGDILVKSDRLSMANSLELRVPFLDKEVYKVAKGLQLDDKIKGRETKVLLREAFKDLLPREVATRKKLGYPVPIRVWLKNELYDWAKNIIFNEDNDIINKVNALELLEEHRKGIRDNSRKLWTIITFNIWMRNSK